MCLCVLGVDTFFHFLQIIIYHSQASWSVQGDRPGCPTPLDSETFPERPPQVMVMQNASTVGEISILCVNYFYRIHLSTLIEPCFLGIFRNLGLGLRGVQQVAN